MVLHCSHCLPLHPQLDHHKAYWCHMATSYQQALLLPALSCSARHGLGCPPRHCLWLGIRLPPSPRHKLRRPRDIRLWPFCFFLLLLGDVKESLPSSMVSSSLSPISYSDAPFRPTVIVGLFMQQAIALFVLKTDAGFRIFLWIATLAADFLDQAGPAAGFFFDAETTAKHWFFVNTLGAIIFFIAFVQMLYYLGVMQWMIKKFAWFFFKTMNVSGAEAVVAAASPWIGQGESACLVRPFVDLMTDSEIHLTMTSGFSTIAGSVFAAYVNMGVPPQNLVTSSVMSIPASIAISKMRIPETDEPLTRGQVVIDQGQVEKGGRPANALHAFSKGATFGLIVAGQILCNVLTVLALVYTIDGLLTWIGKGFGIHQLTLDLIFGYMFYPITFLLGVPRGELLRVARLLATKLVANEFVAYQALREQHAANPFSDRAYTIASYGLCGFANLGEFKITFPVPDLTRVYGQARLESRLVCWVLSPRRAEKSLHVLRRAL